MFRELARKKQQLTKDECVELLKKEKRGVLSVIGDNGYPYGMPMNHFYNEADGKIYFHTGKKGHRTDALKENEKVSFTLIDDGVKQEDGWALTVKSVIVFGRVKLVDDMDKIVDISARLSRKFTNDEEYIEKEIKNYASATLLLELTPEHICGKTVTES